MKFFNLISFALFLLITTACSESNKSKVEYIATGSNSDYNLQYKSADGELLEVVISPQSSSDEWSYSFVTDAGEIVYISGNYNDINSSLKIMILIDGKVFKQASSKADTLAYLTVSGTIPY